MITEPKVGDRVEVVGLSAKNSFFVKLQYDYKTGTVRYKYEDWAKHSPGWSVLFDDGMAQVVPLENLRIVMSVHEAFKLGDRVRCVGIGADNPLRVMYECKGQVGTILEDKPHNSINGPAWYVHFYIEGYTTKGLRQEVLPCNLELVKLKEEPPKKETLPMGRIVYCTDFQKSNRMQVIEQFYNRHGVIIKYMAKVDAYHVGFAHRQHQVVAAENCVSKLQFTAGDAVYSDAVGYGIVKSCYLSESDGLRYVVAFNEKKIEVHCTPVSLQPADYKTRVRLRFRALIVAKGECLVEAVNR